MPRVRDHTAMKLEGRDRARVTVERSVLGKKRIIVRRGNRPVAALVPIGDLRLIEGLEGLEDDRDIKIIRERLAAWERRGRKGIRLAAVAREHGVKL